MKRNKIELGDIFDRWRVIKKGIPIERENGYTRTTWECLCECGIIRDVVDTALKNGSSQSCGCLKIALTSERNKKPPGMASYLVMYRGYKANAKRRELIFNLEVNEFINTIKRNCYYCNDPPIRFNVYDINQQFASEDVIKRAEVFVNGIDRVDNNRGYTLINCVPCCSHCNYAKYTMSVRDFVNHCKKIVAHQEKKDSL